MRLRFRHTAPIALVVAVALLGLFAARNDAAATSFKPTGSFALSSTAPGTHADFTFQVHIPSPDANFAAIIHFIPGQWGLGACPANDPAAANVTCADGSITDGALAGHVDTTATLGLLNNPCGTTVPIPFDMLDATTSMAQTVVYHDTDANGTGQQFEDANGDGLPNGVQMYPEYLQRLLRDAPFPNGSPLQPILRSYGQAAVGSAVPNVSLQFLTFAPGVMINGVPMDPSLGFPVVTVLQDTGDPGAVAAPSVITDFCTPLDSTAVTFGVTEDNPASAGDESGTNVLTNGAAGTYNLVAFLASERDADGDGIPNELDPCPISGNPEGWDPRSNALAGDADSDGLPATCDPNDASPNSDIDGDAFLNRGDNCPLVANPGQHDIDRDGIGDACDPDPATPTGHAHVRCLVQPVEIGAAINAVAAAGNPLEVMPCALMQNIPFGSVDCDNEVTSVDALQILRFVANIQPPANCIDIGDVQCDGDKDSVDALQVLRFVAHLQVQQGPDCPQIGT